MIKNFYLRAVLIILLTTFCCSYFGQALLKTIDFAKNYWKYLIYFLPIILIFTRWSNKYFKVNNVGVKYFIEATKSDKQKVSWYFPIILVVNTLFTHAFGASVGREGVAVQLGGAVGKNLSSVTFSKEKQRFLIRLGMISGFSALFQTPLAAVFFILEITYKRSNINVKTIFELLAYVVASFSSSNISHYLGLEKFFVNISVENFKFSLVNNLKLLLAGIIFIVVGISFVLCQKYLKKLVAKYEETRWILLIVFILISVFFDFRYSSLGTNLIDFSLNNNQIFIYDFLLKLVLTALCTAIGFSGGEVTPLFAIGASLGVVLFGALSLPILIGAALGYVIVFSSATKTFITPIFLALEVFGWQLAFLAIIPALLICFVNKNISIYN